MKLLAIASIALALLAVGALPAAAHLRVYVGGSFPLHVYPYPVFPYPAYAYPTPIPGFEYEAVPPPGWVPGRWGWERDAFGQRHRVWVPPHLR